MLDNNMRLAIHRHNPLDLAQFLVARVNDPAAFQVLDDDRPHLTAPQLLIALAAQEATTIFALFLRHLHVAFADNGHVATAASALRPAGTLLLRASHGTPLGTSGLPKLYLLDSLARIPQCFRSGFGLVALCGLPCLPHRLLRFLNALLLILGVYRLPQLPHGLLSLLKLLG